MGISCAQACMMLAQGSTFEDLSTTYGGMCSQRGCASNVNGHTYSHCGTCSDSTGHTHCTAAGVADESGCNYGATLSQWSAYWQTYWGNYSGPALEAEKLFFP